MLMRSESSNPWSVKATALIDGVIDKVHVLEGQKVAQGDPIATLIAAEDNPRNGSTAKTAEDQKTVVVNRRVAGETVERSGDASANGVVYIENMVGSIEVIGWGKKQVKLEGTLGKDVEELKFRDFNNIGFGFSGTSYG